MFYDCVSLSNINLSNFNTLNVTNMEAMLSGCYSLSNINIPYWINYATPFFRIFGCFFSPQSPISIVLNQAVIKNIAIASKKIKSAIFNVDALIV